MRASHRLPWLQIAALTAGLLACAACAPRQVQVPDSAHASPAPKTDLASTEAALAGSKHSYVVKRGDSLWAIAGRKGVLGDPFQWPLLFRLNRDSISDPDLIHPHLDLSYRTEPNAVLLAQIRKEAEGTPAYRPHIEPRKELPMQY